MRLDELVSRLEKRQPVTGLDLIGETWPDSVAEGAVFGDCRFEGVQFSNADFREARFVRCAFLRCRFSHAELKGAHHAHCRSRRYSRQSQSP